MPIILSQIIGTGTRVFPSGDIVGTSDTQVLTAKTLTNPTITNYAETLHAPAAGASFTVDLVNGTIQKFTSNANLTVTLPVNTAGKSFVVMIVYGGAHTVTWAGGGILKWNGNVAPVTTSVAGKIDIFSFLQDGVNTYGTVFGQAF